VYAPARRYEEGGDGVTPAEMEERLQKIMDRYAGGISTFYALHGESLQVALRELSRLRAQLPYLVARDRHELVKAHEVIDRLDVAEVLVHHLLYRRETRWPGFQTRFDYPERDDAHWLKFVNSRRDPETGRIEMYQRPYRQLVPGDRYRG
ncbi:MAG: adenylylsulfate reductase, partial [Clostridia bacterium]|nr:adenylylsulfate reductase [Clostridia bacterium]